MKKKIFVLAAVLVLLAAAGFAVIDGSSPAVEAKADMIGSNGKMMGVIILTETEKGVLIRGSLKGLKPGAHALHIHATGMCEHHDFMTAGGHFNPYGKEHGFLSPKGPHAGDLPGITADMWGRAEFKFLTAYVTLIKGRPNSLLRPGGTALMVHQNSDDYITNPTGNAGDRVACGVIVEGK